MFISLLNEINLSLDSLILDIFIILGVVIAGSLVVYFLWEAVSSIVNKAKKSGGSISEPVLNLEDKKTAKASVKNDEKAKEEVFVSDFKLDEPVNEEPETLLDESKIVAVDEVKAEEEKVESEKIASQEELENQERRAYLEARRQELIRRMQVEMEEDSEENKEEETEQVTEAVEESEDESIISEDEVQDIFSENEEEEEFEETEEVDETPVMEEVVEETIISKTENLDEERKALAVEKEKYETMIKELEEAKKALAEQSQEVAPVVTTVKRVASSQLSLEELNSRLEMAEERLKATEKEFKQCKKEYLPLRRVWDAHEKDENKLRRKEALVAKQKVLLYGVNNYADIDEDKAKKLAEDLDLLDGLKLSVQHCEEVMKKNEARYPLLEKMYNVLNVRNEELKNDIENYKSEIAKLESQNDGDAE